MLMKLLVSVFERAKSKIILKHSIGQISSESDNEFDPNELKQRSSSGSLIINQQPRLSLSKWLCTTHGNVDKSISSSKSNKVRRSSSWRSLKERGTNCIEQFNSRTLSVDELHRNETKFKKTNSLNKQQSYRNNSSHSSMINSSQQRQKPSTFNEICLSNCDASVNVSKTSQYCDRLSSTQIKSSNTNKKGNISIKSHRINEQKLNSRNNTSSGGGDSGYSEESFATTTMSSSIRPLHTSCPHCHCEQRSSFRNYKKSIETSSTDSSTSDTKPNSADFYYRLFQQKQCLSASRSYPHIKPLPKTIVQSHTMKPIQYQQHKRTKSHVAKRRRNLSCDSSLWTKIHTNQPIRLTPSSIVSETKHQPLQRHFTTIGMINYNSSSTYPKTLSSLSKKTDIFGELNVDAIELDSIRTLDHHRPSFSSTYSSSSSSSVNLDKQLKKPHTRQRKYSQRKGIYLVWHEYRNSSLLSATNGSKIFSVVRGDQVRLLKRIGKSTLLVQKEGDGSIGFLPQSCLAHDQINSFLSVKGLKETVL